MPGKTERGGCGAWLVGILVLLTGCGGAEGGVPGPVPGGGLMPAATCAVPSLIESFPGLLPTNPYDPWEEADDCVASAHDVLVLLGCPSNEDGSPSRCQIERADLAVAFWRAGYARRFITTGAAVHTADVEAEALKRLLLERGVPEAWIEVEPRAEHTDENIYFSSLIMERNGWETALVLSDDAGHLQMTALCDCNCCVRKGRLSLHAFPLGGDGGVAKAGHYVLYPFARPVTEAECDHLRFPLRFMCTQLDTRLYCQDSPESLQAVQEVPDARRAFSEE